MYTMKPAPLQCTIFPSVSPYLSHFVFAPVSLYTVILHDLLTSKSRRKDEKIHHGWKDCRGIRGKVKNPFENVKVRQKMMKGEETR